MPYRTTSFEKKTTFFGIAWLFVWSGGCLHWCSYALQWIFQSVCACNEWSTYVKNMMIIRMLKCREIPVDVCFFADVHRSVYAKLHTHTIPIA